MYGGRRPGLEATLGFLRGHDDLVSLRRGYQFFHAGCSREPFPLCACVVGANFVDVSLVQVVNKFFIISREEGWLVFSFLQVIAVFDLFIFKYQSFEVREYCFCPDSSECFCGCAIF